MRLLLVLALGIGLSACKQQTATDSATKWDQFGALHFNSHSELTGAAIKAANKNLLFSSAPALAKWLPGLYSEERILLPNFIRRGDRMGMEELNGGLYPERHIDEGTGRTQNRLQEGNVGADMPKRLLDISWTQFLFESYCDVVSKMTGLPRQQSTCVDMPNLGPGMAMHFTREFTEKRDPSGKPVAVALTPAYDSCKKSLNAITTFTKRAKESWNEGRRLTVLADQRDAQATSNDNQYYHEDAFKKRVEAMKNFEVMYFFIGIASHAVEDSFAPAHARRWTTYPPKPGEDLRNIKDICYYYKDTTLLTPEDRKSCSHAVGLEPKDNLKNNAAFSTLAVQATAAYLTGLGEVLLSEVATGQPGDVDGFLNKFFLDPSRDGFGDLNCEPLRTVPAGR